MEAYHFTQEDMLSVLHRAEDGLPQLLEDRTGWQSVLVDYELPIVSRLWCNWGEWRIYLHCILPCLPSQALFHPHPWPSAMRLKKGSHVMRIGHGPGSIPPSEDTPLIMQAGSEYQMNHPDDWHAVAPIEEAWTVMVTGKPWDRWSPKPTKQLFPLSEARADELLAFFRSQYPRK